MKKLFTLFLMMLLPLMASADAVEIDGVYYNLDNESKTAEVTRNPDKYSGEVTIPESVSYEEVSYSVISIGDGAFASCDGLTSVTIPNSVINIGEHAFYYSRSLASITIPNSVINIGNYAFFECSSLTSITIPNSVVSIGNSAFNKTAWYDNQPNGIVFAGKVFYCYKGTMPEGTTIDIEEGTLGIADYALRNCSGLTSVTIPNSVTNIGNYAFSSCRNLTSITIPNSVTNIGEDAFSYCSSLTSVTIPNSVSFIGINAFLNSAWYDNLTDGIVYAGNVLYSYKGTMPSGTDLVIKEGIHSITAGAFNNCSGLTSVIIPSSVTKIAFRTFYGCRDLTSITIPSSVTSIEESAFCACSGLTTITIPSSVTTIGKEAFSNCYNLTSIIVDKENKTYDSRDNCNAIIKTATNTLTHGFNITTIPNGVETIGNYAFSGCTFTGLEIPEGVKCIDDYAFYFCLYLSSIEIPKSVTKIGAYAFRNCWSLKDVQILGHIEEMGDGSFNQTHINISVFDENPSDLSEKAFNDDSRTDENNMTGYGGKDWFYSNSKLFVPKGTLEKYQSTAGWKEFKNMEEGNAKNYFSAVNNEGVTIYYKIIDDKELMVTYLGNSYDYRSNEYSGEVIIPESVEHNGHTYPVTTIGKEAFRGCAKLTSVTIPNSVTSIDEGAFRDCSSLADFYCYAKDVPTTDADAFSSSDLSNATLHVPAGSIDAYKAAEPWNMFKEIVAIDEEEETTEDVIKISSAGQTTWCSAYDLDFTDVEGLKAYTATGYHRTKGTIWLTRVKEVPAGEGILLIGDEGEYKVPHVATTAYYANLMVGTVKAITINETEGEYTNYYLSNGASGVGFYKVNGSVDIKANRAYLPLLKNTVSSSRGFIGIDFGDDADGTTNVQSSMFNLQSDEVYYNLQGQRVDSPSKGLYIKNGRKVFIR